MLGLFLGSMMYFKARLMSRNDPFSSSLISETCLLFIKPLASMAHTVSGRNQIMKGVKALHIGNREATIAVYTTLLL